MLQGEINNLCVSSILLNGSDALLHCSCAGIHLAGADYLTVGSLQIEVRLTVLCGKALETIVLGTVLLNGVNALKARFL